jgi:hypothetical protein
VINQLKHLIEKRFQESKEEYEVDSHDDELNKIIKSQEENETSDVEKMREKQIISYLHNFLTVDA